MYGNDRTGIRRAFLEAWRKHKQQLPLEPLERLIAGVITEHPEYHGLLEDQEQALSRDFQPDEEQTNPFLHMGLHISLQEQLGSNRPAGITSLYQQLREKTGDAHAAEHQLMECLGRALWEAQQHGRAPDEQAYLVCIRALLGIPQR